MGVVRKTNGVDRDHTPVAIEPGAAASTVDERSRTLLIVSDIRFLREGLAEVLARERAFALVGVAADLAAALEIARAERPRIILLDTAFPSGLAAAAVSVSLIRRHRSWHWRWRRPKTTSSHGRRRALPAMSRAPRRWMISSVFCAMWCAASRPVQPMSPRDCCGGSRPPHAPAPAAALAPPSRSLSPAARNRS